MEKSKEKEINSTILNRPIKDKDIEKCRIAIKGGIEQGSLKNPGFIRNTVEFLKDKTFADAFEIFSTLLLIFNAKELMSCKMVMDDMIHRKMAEELLEGFDPEKIKDAKSTLESLKALQNFVDKLKNIEEK